MHEGKEAQLSVVIGIEIAGFERLMPDVPQGIHKLLALVVTAQDGSGRRCGYVTLGSGNYVTLV